MTVRFTDLRELSRKNPLLLRGHWGEWKLDVANSALVGPNSHSVDLERCFNSDQILATINHISGKRWCKPDILAGLINALSDLKVPFANHQTLASTTFKVAAYESLEREPVLRKNKSE